MQGKIGLEEHFAIDDTINDSKGFLAERVWPELETRLLDFRTSGSPRWTSTAWR